MEEILNKTTISSKLYEQIMFFYSNSFLSSKIQMSEKQKQDFINIIINAFNEGVNQKCECHGHDKTC